MYEAQPGLQMQYTRDQFPGLGCRPGLLHAKAAPLPSSAHEEKINVLMAARTGERAGERFLKDWLHFPCICLYMHQTKQELYWVRLSPRIVFMLCYNGHGVASCAKKRLFPREQPNITLLHASSMAAEGLDA